MNRLTKPAVNKVGSKYVSAIGSGVGTWGRIIQKLADYENTGMEPEEVAGLIRNFTELGVSFDKLRELVETCGEGKYIRVEALVGETVWVVDERLCVTPWEIKHIDSFADDNRTYYCQGALGHYAFDEEELGDVVFHTPEMAKAAVEAYAKETGAE